MEFSEWRHAVIAATIGGLLCGGLVQAAESKPKRPSIARPAPTPQEEEAPANAAESVKAEVALRKTPKDRSARLQAARAHLAEGAESRSRIDAAQSHAAAILEESPGDVEALLLAAQTSLLKNDPASAARFYRAAAQADNKNATAFLGLGDALSRLGDEPGSSAAFASYRALMGMPALHATQEQR